MKTLNINKLTILICLFFASVFFTTTANALCTVNSDGEIIFDASTLEAPVSDDTTIAGEYNAGADAADCLVTPDTYRLVLHKFGICKADPDLNDLTSCQMFFEQPQGVTVDIKAGVSTALPIPEFYIEPGTYPYLYVLFSNKLGMKWSAKFSAAVDGSSGDGNGGEYCWTRDKITASAPGNSSGIKVVTVHGDTEPSATKVIDCDADDDRASAAFTNEILTRFTAGTDESPLFCDSALAANGDKSDFGIEGVGTARGIPTVNLLTTANAFATTCQNAAKIAWTTALVTSFVVTEDSSFSMSIKATAANGIEFDQGNNNDILKITSGAPRIYLNIN